jgi:hypothetical protein
MTAAARFYQSAFTGRGPAAAGGPQVPLPTTQARHAQPARADVAVNRPAEPKMLYTQMRYAGPSSSTGPQRLAANAFTPNAFQAPASFMPMGRPPVSVPVPPSQARPPQAHHGLPPQNAASMFPGPSFPGMQRPGPYTFQSYAQTAPVARPPVAAPTVQTGAPRPLQANPGPGGTSASGRGAGHSLAYDESLLRFAPQVTQKDRQEGYDDSILYRR